MPSTPHPRERLLDAAERLFAAHGIASVSDRRIAEAAGNTNHSAVRYHFDGREGLLRALISRHHAELEPERAALFADAATLRDDVRALIVPWIRVLAGLPAPSWRARFMVQSQHDPAAVELIRGSGELAPTGTLITSSILARLALEGIDPVTAEGRTALMIHMVATACARVEARAESAGEPARWLETGDFLCDAVVGMLTAPVTSR